MVERVFRGIRNEHVWDRDAELQDFKSLLMSYQYQRDLLDPSNVAVFARLAAVVELIVVHPYQLRQYPYDPARDVHVYDDAGNLDVEQAKRTFSVYIAAKRREMLSGPFYENGASRWVRE
jgi:hypothetical protein